MRPMRAYNALILLAFSTLSPTATGGERGCDDLRGGPITFGVSWENQIKPILQTQLGGRCSGCHMPGQTPDFTDTNLDAIYKIVGSYAIPGDPLISGIFDKVNCELPYIGVRMPLGSDEPLTLEQQGLIYDWIAQGALGEPKGSIPRTFIFRDGAESRRWY
jgi:hypothetical protein